MYQKRITAIWAWALVLLGGLAMTGGGSVWTAAAQDAAVSAAQSSGEGGGREAVAPNVAAKTQTGDQRGVAAVAPAISGEACPMPAYRVDQRATGMQDGLSWPTAFRDIQSAVDAAADGGGAEVWVVSGTYVSTNDPVVAMRPGVCIYGGFAGAEASENQRDWLANVSLIDGEDSRRCVAGSDTAVLDGFTVTRGFSSLAGGGMSNLGVSPTISNCVFMGNSSSKDGMEGGREGGGGGMGNLNSSPTLKNCVFKGNLATGDCAGGGGMFNYASSPVLEDCDFSHNSTSGWGGGGMLNDGGSSPVLTRCAFTENSVDGGYGAGGGGMYNMISCNPVLTNCTFTGNWANSPFGYGGGMGNYHCSPRLTNCAFTGNWVRGDVVCGGGMVNDTNASPTLTNCTFTENSVAGNASTDWAGGGGAMMSFCSSPMLTNCTLTRNSAINSDMNYDRSGGGMVNVSSSPTLTNCILWGNTGSSNKQMFQFDHDTVSMPSATHSCIQGEYSGTQDGVYPGAGNTNDAPKFVDANGACLQLGAGSPGSSCIDTGTNSGGGVPNTDIRGVNRPQGGGCDMGAYEGAIAAGDTVKLTVQKSGKGVTIPAEGDHFFSLGEKVPLFAFPSTGSVFVDWAVGNSSCSSETHTIAMDGNKTVAANFGPGPSHTLTYTAENANGTISGDTPQLVEYQGSGTPVTAVPVQDCHCSFARWSDGSTQNPRMDVNVTGDITVMALFSSAHTLAYGAQEHGAVYGVLNQTVEDGAGGALVGAVADIGYRFAGWGDGKDGSVRQDAKVTADISVRAQFAPVPGVYRVRAGSAANPSTGATWSDAFPTIQSAVDFAADHGGGEVWVAAGTYTATAEAVLTMRPKVNIYGGFAGEGASHGTRNCSTHVTVIDGQNARRCIIGASEAVLDGFTITRGYSSSPGNEDVGGGGGMFNSLSSPTVTNCKFKGNSANGGGKSGGGGMCNVNSYPTLTYCTFEDNSFRHDGGGVGGVGGGMFNWQSAPTLTYCVFTGNLVTGNGGVGDDNSVSGGGGGMFNWQSSPTLRGCAFAGNRVRSDGSDGNGGGVGGGGMYNYLFSSPTLTNCTFTGNSVHNDIAARSDGGGMYNYRFSSPRLMNCTFTGNSASHYGGGMYNYRFSSPRLMNCTFTGNSAGRHGGGMCNESSLPTLTNCILWGDTAFSGAEIFTFNHNSAQTPLVTHSCIQGGHAGDGNICGAPLFLNAGAGNLQLQGDSPCISAGIFMEGDGPATDMLGCGRPHPQGGGIDMGAYERVVPGDGVVKLTILVSGKGNTWPPEGEYWFVRDENVALTLIASETSGNVFTGWTLGSTCCPSRAYNIFMDDNKTVTANFSAGPSIVLTYTAGDGFILGNTPQTKPYQGSGDPVEAVAAHSGCRFLKWSDGSGQNPRTDIDVTGDISVSAVFSPVHSLTYVAGDHGAVNGALTQTVDEGACGMAVNAVADKGWHFDHWRDNATGTVSQGPSVREDKDVMQDLSFTAQFAEGTAVYYVGTSWTEECRAYRDIQSAVDAAAENGGGEVWVAEGRYTAMTAPVVTMRSKVNIYGGFAGGGPKADDRDWSTHVTVIDGEKARPCVFGADDAVLDGFTITGGHSDIGGGMSNSNCSPTVKNCTFKDNSAIGDGGGGMRNIFSSPTLTDCVFAGNSASGDGGGGGILNQQSSPRLKGCLFEGNRVSGDGGDGSRGGVGGGMCNYASFPTLTDCTFAGNLARGENARGAGMFNNGSSPRMTNCAYRGNSAKGVAGAGGGAMYNRDSSSPMMTNCTFTGNMVYGNDGAVGGGMCNWISSPTLINCTFTANSANGLWCVNGGGMFNESSSPTLSNCILWGDTASSEFDAAPSNAEIFKFDHDTASRPLVTHSCIQGGYKGVGVIDADPLFVDANGGNLQLHTGSPCIDKGTAAGVSAMDIRGVLRPQGAGFDMGAYEVVTETTAPSTQ